MTNSTLLKDLSNDIFCEIFDYFNAFDLFFAFASLNSRISSLLKFIRLHVIIHWTYYRHQVELFSHHLTSHSDQVISLSIFDEICDQINVVAYLFSQHIFYCIHSSSKLENVIKQLKNQTQIVSLHIVQSYDAEQDKLCRNHASLFSEMFLVNTSLTLHSATLRFHYDHPELTRSTIINTKLTYLELMFYGTLNNISIYCLIPVLRIHDSLQHFGVIIKSSTISQNNNNNIK